MEVLFMRAPIRDPRVVAQATVLWDRGWGEALHVPDFATYLATIPDPPAWPEGYADYFPFEVLVDRRVRIATAARLLTVEFAGSEQSVSARDPRASAPSFMYWMRAQDGRAHLGHAPGDCLTHFDRQEVALDLVEGLALVAQYPDAPAVGAGMDLVGSTFAGKKDICMTLRRYADGATIISVAQHNSVSKRYGSASRGMVVGP